RLSSATTGCCFDITSARTDAAAIDSGEPGIVAPVGRRGCGIGDCPHSAMVLFGPRVRLARLGPSRFDVRRFVAPGGDGHRVDAPGMGPTCAMLDGLASPGGINVDARVGGAGVGTTAIDGRPGVVLVSVPAPPANASSQITRARPDANGSSARPKSSMLAKRA